MISEIKLSSFRNHDKLVEAFHNSCCVIVGDNGVGKTAILEAISLMEQGSGFRASSLAEIVQFDAQPPLWKSEITLNDSVITIEYNQGKRLSYNGNSCSAKDLGEIAKIIWLTPDINLAGAKSDRRRFFDRIVHRFNCQYVSTWLRYKHYIKSRANLFSLSGTAQLAHLEGNIAKLSYQIYENRIGVISLLNAKLAVFEIRIAIHGRLEELISSALDPMESIRCSLERSRSEDLFKNAVGPQRSDFMLYFKGKALYSCSTGEQKFITLLLLVAQIQALQELSYKVILLLDDLTANLDCLKQAEIIEYLIGLGSQIFITSTQVPRLQALRSSQIITLKVKCL